MNVILITAACMSCLICAGQDTSSLRKKYAAAQKNASAQFAAAYYPNRAKIYSQEQKQFLQNIDSLKQPFLVALSELSRIDPDRKFILDERRDIDYFFDRMILDYPYFHHNHTRQRVKLSKAIQKRLDKHLPDFNNPSLLGNGDVKGYIQAFLRHASSREVTKPDHKRSDNKRLDAYLNLIPKYFIDQQCREFWQYFYISNHLENWGSKNMEKTIEQFMASCKNDGYKKTIDAIYTESNNERKNHLVKTYKSVDGYSLDIHLFLPESTIDKRPVIVYLSGGSWTEGNPEWAFYSCADYAKKGWVGVSVEYRLADRHETTPFEAVRDARSAIRWLRKNADTYHIDTNRIVVSGNSAGGHLALTTALADSCNEATDDKRFGASPNLILINAGVYDLYAEDNSAWITWDLSDKRHAETISPIHLARKNVPPMLIIHGTADRSVGYTTALAFVAEMKRLGNDVEFQSLEGAPHHIWFDRRFSGKVAAFRKEFLKRHGYGE